MHVHLCGIELAGWLGSVKGQNPSQKMFAETASNNPFFSFVLKPSLNSDVIKQLTNMELEPLSSLFVYQDDPLVLEIVARNKKEADKVAARSEGKVRGRKKENLAKMANFSTNLYSSQSSTDKFKLLKLEKKQKRKKKVCSKASKKEVNDEELEEADFTPSIEELLKLPDRLEDGGKTMDEVLDELDKEIANRQRRHEEEMVKIDTDIATEKKKQEERRERMMRNAVNRDRLEAEVTEVVLRRMFRDNLDYLKKIQSGEFDSSRHKAYHKSCRTRHALYYCMITDPYTDDQLEWTLDEIGQVWMKNKKEEMDNNEYVWKVLLAECFIKLYMDYFNVSKQEAEKRISETPLRKTGGDSDDSSDDEV